MTLLSIREQEAVQDAARTLLGKLCTNGKLYEEVQRDIDVLILATRDAIARQVREKAERMSGDNITRVEAVATFIEEMRCV